MAYQVRPDLTMLRAWGCLAYTYLPRAPHRRIGKFSDRAHVGYFVGVSRYIRGWDIYVPSVKQYVSSRHVRFDATRYYGLLGGGALDPEARGCYSHPSEYLELDNTMADATGENELPVGDHRGLIDASAVEHTAEVEPLQTTCDATVNQARCRTPGCTRPLNHEGAHSDELRGWNTPGVPSARLRSSTSDGAVLEAAPVDQDNVQQFENIASHQQPRY